MLTSFCSHHETPVPQRKNMAVAYTLDEMYLFKLGFSKLLGAPDEKDSTFRYYNPNITGAGFDLIYANDFGVVTVEEFSTDPGTGNIFSRNPIVGMFHIKSDEDLKFIFSRNVRLNLAFGILPKRISSPR
jgi:hypothetical protein